MLEPRKPHRRPTTKEKPPTHIDPNTNMPTEPEKHPLQSKTIWGLITMLLGTVAAGLGWPDGSFEFLADGLQLVDVGAIISLIGFLWSQYGLRAAKAQLTTVSGKHRAK